MKDKNKPIGFFDSGVGGLSVLKKAIQVLPRENYIYFGDSLNAPYGIKSVEEVKELTFKAVEFLISKGAKAVVIACNTATSAAIEDLRDEYKEFPIIGIEPALKPAIELKRRGPILIMATPMTLAEKKFAALWKSYGENAEIESLPCAELVEFVESGKIEGDELEAYLMDKLNKYMGKQIGSIVLGCTHYPFVKATIAKVVGEEVPILDGSLGTAKQLRKKLIELDLMNEAIQVGKVDIFNSLNSKEIIDLSYKLLKD